MSVGHTSFSSGQLYKLPMAAVTKCHRLCSLDQQTNFFPVLTIRHLKSVSLAEIKVWAGQALWDLS